MEINKKVIHKIGEAIRGGKYLSIYYKNKQEEIRHFWICILDLNNRGQMVVDMFNVNKDEPILQTTLYLAAIQSAEILKFSHYDVPEQLIKKLQEDESLHVYEFERYDNAILNYYLECYKANSDPFLHQAYLLPEIDLTELLQHSPFQLSLAQQQYLLKEIYHNEYNKFQEYKLALSEFSIDMGSKGKFVVAYRELTYDPVKKTLLISKFTHFNPHFYIKDVKYSLSYYTDMSTADFEDFYLTDPAKTIEWLSENFRVGELPNTRPEVVVLG